jgi:hypothetical protein
MYPQQGSGVRSRQIWIHVPPDTWLPGGRKISVEGHPVLWLSTGKDLAQLIDARQQDVSEEDRDDPSFAPRSEIWNVMLVDERQVRVNAYEGPMHP